MTQDAQEQWEEQHLQETLALLRENIRQIEERAAEKKAETGRLTEQITPRDREMNSQLFMQLNIASSLQEHLEGQLRKNQTALRSPYFGRVDFLDLSEEEEKRHYIGKNGIQKDMEPYIIDWRAPVAKLYYENESGPGSYEVPDGARVEVDLRLKRTFDIDEGVLAGFYDSDIAANDELLIKYLAKHKDLVLGDIIATIQKEQDQIIRSTPFQNTIVQGVAGSGKTTVALHKISHILYNYPHRFQSRDFLLIGGNRVLLNYITSGLPELDVGSVREHTMTSLFEELCEEAGVSLEGYTLTEPEEDQAFKAGLPFIKALAKYLEKIWLSALRPRPVVDEELGELLSRDKMYELLNPRRAYSVARLSRILQELLMGQIDALFSVSADDEEPEKRRARRDAKKKAYRDYFARRIKEQAPEALMGPELVYQSFLQGLGPEGAGTLSSLGKKRADVYDLAALTLCGAVLSQMEPAESFGLVMADEAQDFGPALYYVLRRQMPKSFFTLLGDVSQNIQGPLGMDSWQPLLEEVFEKDDSVYRELRKSYRNTIEISEFATELLREGGFREGMMEPVIRHGEPVEVIDAPPQAKLDRTLQALEKAKEEGHQSFAVIVETSREAEALCGEPSLQPYLSGEESMKLMILPVDLVKGLEFDAVLIYQMPQNAKKAYVAATRALHRLWVFSK